MGTYRAAPSYPCYYSFCVIVTHNGGVDTITLLIRSTAVSLATLARDARSGLLQARKTKCSWACAGSR